MILISSTVGINISNIIIGKIIIKKKYFKLFKFDKCNPIMIVVNIRVSNLITDIIDSLTLIEYKIDNADHKPKISSTRSGLLLDIDFIILTSDFLKRKNTILKKLTMFKYSQ